MNADRLQMKRNNTRNFIHSNSGETLVEIMVAFIVLMIVVAMFTGAVTSASAAINNSIDIRRTSDNEYTELHKELNKEDRDSTYVSPFLQQGINKETTITGTDGNSISITAKQYISGETVYWVFR